ncbi:MAG: preprotein translocase subunit YajC [Gammaproteobacteria bacterium]|nr:MAG: preprotein translocase subunit YajC [Gammaproteobacteria bacterium]
MSFLFNDVIAAEAGAAVGQGSPYSSIIMLVVFGLIFYFMLIRPQSKRAKEHKEMLGEIQKGDEVVTNGGLVGKVAKVGESFITITVSDNVTVNVQKHAVSASLPKGTIKSI